MPLVIDNPSDESCSLPEAIEALAELGFDPRDDDNCIEAAKCILRARQKPGPSRVPRQALGRSISWATIGWNNTG